MTQNQPRLLQTYLIDGTLEGVRIVDCESNVKAFVIPRLKLSDAKNREELSWPALYFLISASENRAYIGESESFFHRVKNHDQNKDWWDVAIAVVSTTNSLEKSDVKYLESLAVERAQEGSMNIENKTAPIRNNIHEFKLHKLQQVLDDTQFMLTLLGYDVLSSKEEPEQVWYCKSKKTDAKAVFKGGNFIVLAGSIVDIEPGKGWSNYPAYEIAERQVLISTNSGTETGDTITLKDNVSFKSPNHAGRTLLGRSANAWTTWKNAAGQTMDDVMRKGE
jgi:hypothetical protein